MTKAPTISTAVTQTCRAHGISLPKNACSTDRGLGSRYSRSPRNDTASCQTTISAAKIATAGQ